jgi:hypothetical protein
MASTTTILLSILIKSIRQTLNKKQTPWEGRNISKNTKWPHVCLIVGCTLVTYQQVLKQNASNRREVIFITFAQLFACKVLYLPRRLRKKHVFVSETGPNNPREYDRAWLVDLYIQNDWRDCECNFTKNNRSTLEYPLLKFLLKCQSDARALAPHICGFSVHGVYCSGDKPSVLKIKRFRCLRSLLFRC